MATSIYTAFLLAILFTVVRGEQCMKTRFFGDTQRFYCSSGCCGNWDDEYCCMDSEAGQIAGIVIVSLVGVGVLVTILVTIFCCLRKSRGAQGRTLSNTNAGMGTTTTTNIGGMPMQSNVMVTSTAAPGVYPTYPYGQPQPIATYPGPQLAVAPPTADEKWQQPPPAYNTIN